MLPLVIIELVTFAFPALCLSNWDNVYVSDKDSYIAMLFWYN